MMKTSWILFCFLFLNYIVIGQDTILTNHKEKFSFSVKAGGYCKFFLGNTYIAPTPENYGDDFQEHQYDRFTKVPTYGLQTGFQFSYNIHKRWFFVFGLSFCNRRNVFENNQDTVIKYGIGSNTNDIYNVYKYDYSYNNIELQIMLLYKFKKISIYTGVYIPALTFYKATYSYIILTQLPEPHGTSQKTIKGVEIPLMIFPSIFASYKVTIRTFSFDPYLGVDFGSKKSIYLQFGTIFTLVSF